MLAHSNEGAIYRHAYDPVRAGSPGKIFARVEAAEGMQDGAAMDEDGCYWGAIHGGSILHRYDPECQLVCVVDLTVSHPPMRFGRRRA